MLKTKMPTGGLTNDSCLQKVAVINVIFNINNNGVFIRKGNAC